MGDKVIQTSNNYDLNVFNGDIGYIRELGVDSGKMAVQYVDRTVWYEKEQIIELRLAYAITIHKSQGSEFPCVVIPISSQHYRMLQRNLIYTGLTRARQQAFLIGDPRYFKHAINNCDTGKRRTGLRQRIVDATLRS